VKPPIQDYIDKHGDEYNTTQRTKYFKIFFCITDSNISKNFCPSVETGNL